jgi:hypothetical protein
MAHEGEAENGGAGRQAFEQRSLYRSFDRVLRPHVAAIRTLRGGQGDDFGQPPTRRRLWARYLRAMITVQTRMTAAFWRDLDADRRWRNLLHDGPEGLPPTRVVRRLLRDHGVRFASQKADRIRTASSRQWDLIAESALAARGTLNVRTRQRHRLVELAAADTIQRELASCGVAPKVSRLMLTGADWALHLVPIDSRWVSALRSHGFDVLAADLASETRYRAIENAICRCAYVHRIPPVYADGVVFGWLSSEVDQ